MASEEPFDLTDATQALESSETAFDRLRQTMRTLVWPNGCAWHAEQTHASLTPYLVEETAEFIETVDHAAAPEDAASELGDVLYQVLFHAAIAERDGEGYDLDTVATVLNDKLVARHPHVFGDRGFMSVEELNAEWERLKEDAAGERRGSRGALEGIPAGMPTLARAAKVIERLKRAELLDPAAEASRRGADTFDEQRLGDALMQLVIDANAAGLDPDRALRLATARIAERGPVEE